MDAKKTPGKGTAGKSIRNLILVFVLFILLIDVLDLLGIVSIPELMAGKRQTAVLPGEEVAVSFIDVGQGDSIFINACGRTILIDAGERDQGGKVVSYLREQGVEKLNMIIVTHPHSDHIGGMTDVVKEIGAEMILIPKLPDTLTPTTVSYENFLNAVAENGFSLTQAKAGDEYRFGDAYLKILSPSEDADYTDINEYSAVARLTFEDTSFLFTGDAGNVVEKALRSSGRLGHTDVLKVGHHGSDTASSKKFLERIMPDYAVISCGVDNSYSHPNDKVMERLEKNAGMILRTDINGTVIIRSDGKNIEYALEKGTEVLTNAGA